jgi:hypothetical protein
LPLVQSNLGRREGEEVVMEKIILFLMIGLVGSWMGTIAEQVGYERFFESEPGWLEMIFGIVGTSASSYLLLYTSETG